jgi:hypothetical protein
LTARPPALFLLAYGLLLVAWSFGNPPFAAPDESAHYVRAVGLANGQLLGTPTSMPDAPQDTRLTLAWKDQSARAFRMPSGLSPRRWDCNWFDATVPATCQLEAPRDPAATTAKSYVGTYFPLPYLLPGLAARAGGDPGSANRLARIAGAAVSAALLALALVLLWDGSSPFSLLGAVVAATPMVVFVLSTVNPSALEIASGFAFAASILRLSREPYGSAAEWAAFAASGALLALSRSTGPLWLAFLLVICGLFGGRGAVGAAVRSHRRAAAAAVAAVAGAAIVNRVWEAAYGPHLTVSLRPLSSLSAGVDQLPRTLTEEIGVFDYLEIGMPFLAYVLWWALVFALLTIALLVGTLRQRLVLLAAAAGALIVPVLFYAAVYRFTGFTLQGRYFLPIVLVVPLLAGETVRREHARLAGLGARRLLLWFASVAALVQFVAWYANAQRFAVGRDGSALFVADPAWSPPLGWWPWLLVAAAAVPVFVVAALTAARVGDGGEGYPGGVY